MTLVWRPGFAYDTDASAYIDAVEAADEIASPGIGALETATRYAINDFVIGCKQDGIWTAIKASCILAGARTLAGALQPLVGTAPTNNGFIGIGTDYVRKTGLVGNGSTKYLNSNRNNNADPQDNRHASVYVSVAPTATAFRTYISAGGGTTAGGTIIQIGSSAISGSSVNHLISKSSGSINALTGIDNQSVSIGLKGVSRNTSASHTLRSGNNNFTVNDISASPFSGIVNVYATSSPSALIDARLAFYSIGESLDLARLDARVTDLINAFAVAIP